MVGLASEHQLLQLSVNQAEPEASADPKAGRGAPGVSLTVPPLSGRSTACSFTDTAPPASSSRLTLRGLPSSQQGSEPMLATTTAPARDPPAPWNPRKIPRRSAGRQGTSSAG